MRKLRFCEAKNLAQAHKAREYKPGTQFRAQLLPTPMLFVWGLCAADQMKPCTGQGGAADPWQSLEDTLSYGTHTHEMSRQALSPGFQALSAGGHLEIQK